MFIYDAVFETGGLGRLGPRATTGSATGGVGVSGMGWDSSFGTSTGGYGRLSPRATAGSAQGLRQAQPKGYGRLSPRASAGSAQERGAICVSIRH